MRNHRLDPNTIQRLSSGWLHPDDAPPGYGAVAALLGGARPAAAESDGEVPARVLAELFGLELPEGDPLPEEI